MFDKIGALAFLALATSTHAQGYGGYGGGSGSGNPYNNGGNGENGSPFGSSDSFFTSYPAIVTAHAVLATLAFGLLFPVGAIIIRLGSFPGAWLVHGIFQAFAYLLYIAAFGIGIYMAKEWRVLSRAHPIIGIILFVLIFFQPFLGFLHHFAFKKHTRRVIWSYGHIWLGRIIITLGIINGGLGLQLGQQLPFFRPSNGVIIGYSVAAGIMWLLYVAAAIVGERKRNKSKAVAPPQSKQRDEGVTQYA